MEAFEIVRLVGASIALVVAAIVFLVVFFRGISWLAYKPVSIDVTNWMET